MIKAVIIGFSHMHVNEIAQYISEQPDFTLAAVAEVAGSGEGIPPLRYTPAWNLANVKEKYCQNEYADYREMLDTEKPDIAFILTENCQKPDVVEECAKRGVNVCIEKPMAVSYAEAKRIEAAVKKYGIQAVVNWPVIWRPYLHKLSAAVESGIVGKPIKMRYINGHTGPLGKGARHRGVAESAEEMTDEIRGRTWWHNASHGGGVFLDISCYGCLFTQWLMGDGAESVLAYGADLNTPFGDTADNAAAIIRFADKMSVIEGTWTTPRALIPSGPMVNCTDGVVTCTGGAEDTPDVKAYDMFGKEIALPDSVPDDSMRNMPWHWAAHVQEGKPLCRMVTLEENLRVMAILDAVIRASESGKAESV